MRQRSVPENPNRTERSVSSEPPAEVMGRVYGIVWSPLEIGLSFPTGTGTADCSEGEAFTFIWEKENGPNLPQIWEKTISYIGVSF